MGIVSTQLQRKLLIALIAEKESKLANYKQSIERLTSALTQYEDPRSKAHSVHNAYLAKTRIIQLREKIASTEADLESKRVQLREIK